MKTSLSLTQLAQEIERQADAKHDYIADTRNIVMTDDGGALQLATGAVPQSLPLTTHAAGQLAERLGIPKAFYDRMRGDHPDVLAHTVNRLFEREPAKTMVRTLDGNVRGLVSDRFRPLDNFDLAEAALPALMKAGARIESCDITETRMWIKATLPGLDRELPVPAGVDLDKIAKGIAVGHTIFPRALRGAIVIRNSEVGAGALTVAPAIMEKQCTNLATFKDDGYGVMHLGRRQSDDGNIRELLQDDTKRLEDAAIWAKMRDVIAAICSGKVMDRLVANMLAAREDDIGNANPAGIVEVFGKRHGLSEAERGGLLRTFMQAGETTRYGLQWAVTRLAGDVENYDRASELERLGGQVIELPRSDWASILKQAA